jgi:hypothetical protein
MSYSQNRTKHSSKETEMPNAEKPKPKIKITGSAKAVPVPPKKTFKPGSMITSSKNVTVPASKKASTKYSPAPMSSAAKKKATAAGKETTKASIQKSNKKMGITSELNKSIKAPKKASTSYSPKAFDTRAAAVKRGEASRKELASKVVKAVNKTARYTPMGVIGQGAVKAGRILSKVIPKK